MELWKEFKTFGESLLITEDLDPLYITLYKQRLPDMQLRKWLIAYWCFYHAGEASKLSESINYYEDMRNTVLYGSRCSERRHFRGAAGIKSVNWLEQNDAVGTWFGNMINCADYNIFAECIQEAPLFGPWITFKAADMLERLDIGKMDFKSFDISIYSEPLKGSSLVIYGDEDHYISCQDIDIIVKRIQKELSSYKAPPTYNRELNIQEVETMLCKFKSYKHGRYIVGKDIHEIAECTNGFGTTAKGVEQCLPKL